MVPLRSVVTTRYVTGPDLVTRFNNFPAVKVTAGAAPGCSSGEAIAALEETAAQALPSDFGLAWSGEAFEEKKAGGASAIVFVFGLIMVFLILAAQYEKWSLPLGVLTAVPFALFGALLAILLRGLNNDVYFQIGLTMLVALAAKNAILIFEYAVMNRGSGQSVYDAAINAAHDRLRPIVMTSLAFILGCVPLAISVGVAANSKHSIGTGVIGGMLGATVIAVFFIPMFYYVIESLSEKFSGGRQRGAGARAAALPRRRRRMRSVKTERSQLLPQDTEVTERDRKMKVALPSVSSVISVAVLLGVTTGCTVGPNYERPAIDAPQRYRFEDAAARDTANIAWWRLFGDAELDRLVGISLAENKSVLIAAARVEEFYGRYGVQRGQQFPQVGVDRAGRQPAPLAGRAPRPSPTPSTSPRISTRWTWAFRSSWTCGAGCGARARPRARTCSRRRRTGAP